MLKQVKQDTQLLYRILCRHGYSSKTYETFKKIIVYFFQKYGRDFPWRNTRDSYRILVSECMLQQTQTQRVLKKYESFIQRFPHFASLACASFQEIMRYWQGLGYNRRALFLHMTAQRIQKEYGGVCPSEETALTSLPGIGRATASAICAFAFNKPSIFVETNIRSVFIHFFFSHKHKVKDSEIVSLVEKTLDTAYPRQWYYGLMDYGALIKKEYPNPSRKSAHHGRQSSFINSNRQIRGMILKILTQQSPLSEDDLYSSLSFEKRRIYESLIQLRHEKLITKQGEFFIL